VAIEANVKMLTTTDVAGLLGVKPDTVRKYVQRKQIVPFRMIGTAHLFKESECKRFARVRRKRGNPQFSNGK